jgi:hypothetical protein
MPHDLIGDIHGHADELKAMLLNWDMSRTMGSFDMRKRLCLPRSLEMVLTNKIITA